MMKKITISVAAIVALSSFGFAGGDIAPVPVPVPVDESQDYFYGGVALTYHTTYSIDQSWFDNSVATQDETGGIMGIIGYNYNQYLAVEGRIDASFFDEDYAETFGWSIFVKPQYQFLDDEKGYNTDYFTLYGLLGFGGVKVEGTDGNAPAHPADFGKTIIDDTTFQWGIGLSYTFVDEDDADRSGDWSIFVEYVNLLSDGDINSQLYGYDPQYYTELSQETINVGLTYRF
jgi:opacity protein-like surface antigen